ncbi:hypothetical protein ACAG26_07710 [Mycobacterium sp. pUA109]|uniref:hypothetical protein n=1 Tax=Mycobacterium sp. pUA109 TaxID=3238982 RepID=UPI00351AE6CD
MGDVLYDYQGMETCLADVNKSIDNVNHAMTDVNQIIMSLEEVYKTKSVAEAQTAAYRQVLQQMQDQVLDPLTQQRDYVQHCMDEANEGDTALAKGWS